MINFFPTVGKIKLKWCTYVTNYLHVSSFIFSYFIKSTENTKKVYCSTGTVSEIYLLIL